MNTKIGPLFRQSRELEKKIIEVETKTQRARVKVRPVIVFFSSDLDSGLALFRTLRQSEVLALIREWM